MAQGIMRWKDEGGGVMEGMRSFDVTAFDAHNSV